MASQPGTSQEELNQLAVRQHALDIAETNVEDLVRNSTLGTDLGFETARPLFLNLKAIFGNLASSDLTAASESKLAALFSLTAQVKQQFELIKSFSPRQSPNPIPQRDNIISGLRPLVDVCFDEVAKVVAFTNTGRASAMMQQASEALAAIHGSNADATAALNDLKSTLDKARQAAQQVGIVQHAQFFKEESDGHKTAARIWLGVTILLTLLAIGVGWWNYSHSLDALTSAIGKTQQPEKSQDGSKPSGADSGTTALQIQLALAKLIIFSVLFSAVIWTGKMYRAHRHNFVINRHRLNALSTFEAFAKATDDQQIKNAVLLQATQCIFGPQPTGYISGENESEGYPQILEIVRGMGAGDKSK